ncbi:RmlC-like cupins superfamily protein [Melia azedarach]|uniref:RmlC-like cupins superfamily protein n=1 Tax=Melia azedarach TaxID=155640 RepID=A0ACC1XR66_MELAZ|nr:RmlC-like cupins superfamily protein [Melia azedarach]
MFRSSVVSLKYGTLSVAVSSSRKAEEIMANFALNHTLMLSLLLVLLVSLLVPLMITAPKSKPNSRESKDKSLKMAVTTTTTEIFGVKIEKNPPQSKISELGVTSWPKWGCPPSKFPWTFTATETMYLLEGKVKVYVDGSEGSFEIGAGDLVVFPKGMKITWDVIEAVNKHYSLEK